MAILSSYYQHFCNRGILQAGKQYTFSHHTGGACDDDFDGHVFSLNNG
jgi:hypothetical protein